MISDKAVEAAMAAAVESSRETSPNLAAGLDGFDQVFRAALDAAAPHMLAEAWDECNSSDTPWINPYRSQP